MIQQRFHNFFRGEGKGPDFKIQSTKQGAVLGYSIFMLLLC